MRAMSATTSESSARSRPSVRCRVPPSRPGSPSRRPKPFVLLGAISDDVRAACPPVRPTAPAEMKRGFAFVEYNDERDAHEALNQAPKVPLSGRTVRVEFCKPKGTAPRRDEGGGRGPPGGAWKISCWVVGCPSVCLPVESEAQLLGHRGRKGGSLCLLSVPEGVAEPCSASGRAHSWQRYHELLVAWIVDCGSAGVRFCGFRFILWVF